MRKLSAILVCLVLLLFLPVTASADVGPKPSVQITFTGIQGQTYYGTLLSQRNTTGPASAWDGKGAYPEWKPDGEEDIWQKYINYQDADGYFFHERVDLLIVAPNSAEKLTAVIDSAYTFGIPVILFDRKTNSEKYTAFMGADNYLVGKTMGELIGEEMGGQGTLVEITGLKGSSSAIERHRGFTEAIAAYPNIRLISSELGDWTQKSGEEAMMTVIAKETVIFFVAGIVTLISTH